MSSFLTILLSNTVSNVRNIYDYRRNIVHACQCELRIVFNMNLNAASMLTFSFADVSSQPAIPRSAHSLSMCVALVTRMLISLYNFMIYLCKHAARAMRCTYFVSEYYFWYFVATWQSNIVVYILYPFLNRIQ